MAFKLRKNSNGKINALLRTGKDFVKTELSLRAVNHLIATGELVDSDRPDYPIHVGEWYFEGDPVKETDERPIKRRKK